MKENHERNFKRPKLLYNPFLDNWNGVRPAHTFSPQNMCLPSQMQPPPMYGPRGPTIPPKFLKSKVKQDEVYIPKQHFWCETCDIDFKSNFELKNHKDKHETCSVDGCSFTGIANVLSEHVLNQHNSGLYDTIKRLNTPEEIEKWREERKRRYPSVKNVELRQCAQKEKFKRGEKLQKPNNRFPSKNERRRLQNKSTPVFKIKIPNSTCTSNSKHNQYENSKKSRTVKNYPKLSLKSENNILPDSKKNLEATDSTKYFNKLVHNFEGTSKMYNVESKSEKEKSHPLLSMLGMYGSSDEDSSSDESSHSDIKLDSCTNQQTHELSNQTINNEDSEPNEIIMKEHNKRVDEVSQKIETSKHENKNLNVSCTTNTISAINYETQSDSEPEEVPIEKHCDKLEEVPIVKEIVQQTNSNSSNKQIKNVQQKSRNKKSSIRGLNYKMLYTSKANTMLAKLLEPDIRHERNILLQCVRFVVDNNFFDEKKCVIKKCI